MWLGLGQERGRATGAFPCDGAKTFMSILVWGVGAGCEGMRGQEDRGDGLERGKQSTPGGLSY